VPLISLVLAAALAAAPNSTPYSDSRPPVLFQRDATMTLEVANQGEIDDTCHALFGNPPSGMRTQACTSGRKVIMPNPCSFPDSDAYAHLLCHELGHLNGWPATHGDFPTPVMTKNDESSPGKPDEPQGAVTASGSAAAPSPRPATASARN
jgi:hypothetical protein